MSYLDELREEEGDIRAELDGEYKDLDENSPMSENSSGAYIRTGQGNRPLALVLIVLFVFMWIVGALIAIAGHNWIQEKRSDEQANVNEMNNLPYTEKDVNLLNSVLSTMSMATHYRVTENYTEKEMGKDDILFTLTQDFSNDKIETIDAEVNEAFEQRYADDGMNEINEGVCSVAFLPTYCVDIQTNATSITVIHRGEFDGGNFELQQLLYYDKLGRVKEKRDTLTWSNDTRSITDNIIYTQFEYPETIELEVNVQ